MSNSTNSEAGADVPADATADAGPTVEAADLEIGSTPQLGPSDVAVEDDLSIDIGSVPEAGSLASSGVDARASASAEEASTEEESAEVEVPGPSLAELRRADGSTIALVAGLAVTELPKDLYIPPEALEVFLETFEGPLDLLLYLIRRQNLDILDVSVSEITTQYMGYIDLMTELQLELVGEYLVMAAMLAEIKSRMLLPRPESIAEEEDDPRAELIRRLQQYERFKTAAEHIDEMPRLDRDIRIAHAERPTLTREKPEPDVDLREMLLALGQIMRKADMFQKHAVQFEPLTVRERMSNVLVHLRDSTEFVPFAELFNLSEGRGGVVVTFLAILELVKERMLDFVQNEPFAPLYVRTAQGETEATKAEPEEATGRIDDAFYDPDFKLPARTPTVAATLDAEVALAPDTQVESEPDLVQSQQTEKTQQSEQDAAASFNQADSSE